MGLETVGLIFSGVSAVTKFVGGIQQAKAQRKAAERNASELERQALEREEQKQEQLKIQRREDRQAQAEAEARMAANGIDISRGSAGSVLGDFAQLRQEDSNALALQAERDKRNLRQRASDQLAQGQAGYSAGVLNASGSLITGGTKVATRWANRPKTRSA
ncbi:MAG: hypothetical protein AAFR16_00365 [Pseudomonadota bacterium]